MNLVIDFGYSLALAKQNHISLQFLGGRIFLERGGPRPFLLLIGILIFMLLRSPCKNLKPYDYTFWDFSNGGKKKEREED